MKLKLNTFAVAFVAAFSGGALGVGISGYLLALYLSDAAYSRFIGDATFELAVLEKLQVDDIQGAALILNAALAGNVAALDLSDSRIPDSKREQIRQLLRRVDSYREKQK